MSAHETTGSRPRVVIAGGGFAGFHAARQLGKLAKGKLDIVLVNPTDYFLYLPLLPEVTAGILDPRTVAAPLTSTCRSVRHVLGAVTGIDVAGKVLTVRDPEDNPLTLGYDQLVVALGSVNKLLPIPGVTDHAHNCCIYFSILCSGIRCTIFSNISAISNALCSCILIGFLLVCFVFLFRYLLLCCSMNLLSQYLVLALLGCEVLPVL